jgi:hypothetical protein
VAYAERLGLERMRREDVRTRLNALLAITVELEQMHAARLGGKQIPIHNILHASAEQRALIAELGLSDASTENGAQASSLYQIAQSIDEGED